MLRRIILRWRLILLALAIIPSPASAQNTYRQAAKSAVNDLVIHFWSGEVDTGHITPTFGGLATDIPKGLERGVLWERATMVMALTGQYQATEDIATRQRLASEWNYLRTSFTQQELTSCGANTLNPCHDDAGWTAVMYFNLFRVLGDRDALHDAEKLFTNAFDRWQDDTLGGGMWYRDQRDFKCSYQATIIWLGIRLYEVTRNPVYWQRALKLYNWMEAKMLRPDGLYWCEMRASGPPKDNTIREGASVSFIGGNMAMAVVHARLYRDTGDAKYQDRAVRTADGITTNETDGKGCYLDDRDPWADGYFMGEWAREVLCLPRIIDEHRAFLRRTADAVLARARSAAGYYSGCWNGPADDMNLGGGHTRLMTNASAVNIIVGAAILESHRAPWPSDIKAPAGTW